MRRDDAAEIAKEIPNSYGLVESIHQFVTAWHSKCRSCIFLCQYCIFFSILQSKPKMLKGCEKMYHQRQQQKKSQKEINGQNKNLQPKRPRKKLHMMQKSKNSRKKEKKKPTHRTVALVN